jgi:hypothetical protein
MDTDMDLSPGFSLWISGAPDARRRLADALAARLGRRGSAVRQEDDGGGTLVSCGAPPFTRGPTVEAVEGDAEAAADRLVSLLEAEGLLPAADAQAERDEALLLERLRGLGYL